MKPHSHSNPAAVPQRGVVLFVALIALVVMSLAAVALIRSVDTATIIAGNLAFRQAATTTSDRGFNDPASGALAWLTTTDTSNSTKDPTTDATHAFNITNTGAGYYSNADPALSLTADGTWTGGSVALADDGSGYTVRYLIQRMCRTANQLLAEASCLLSDADIDTGSKRVLPSSEGGANKPGKPPLYRITIRTAGPRNTFGYIQAFVY